MHPDCEGDGDGASTRREGSRQSPEAEGDFSRVLVLLATDQDFEARALADPETALAAFGLDETERAVLRDYRRWQVFQFGGLRDGSCHSMPR
jgi:hypothetical protein